MQIRCIAQGVAIKRLWNRLTEGMDQIKDADLDEYSKHKIEHLEDAGLFDLTRLIFLFYTFTLLPILCN